MGSTSVLLDQLLITPSFSSMLPVSSSRIFDLPHRRLGPRSADLLGTL